MILTQKNIDNFWRHVEALDPNSCWEWQGARDKQGYGIQTIRKKFKLAHRMSFLVHNGSLTPGLFVLHSCDNPPCVNPAHLREGTPKDNSADAVQRNRLPKKNQQGDKNHNAQLTATDVIAIRELNKQGFNNKQIAARFGVTHSMISRIILGKSWTHI